MIVLICGGRDYSDRTAVECVMSDLCREATLVIHGGASGADTLAGETAASMGIPVKVYKAEWSKYGPSAGPRRNALMLRDGKPDLVIAFPGGRGTEDMVRRARFAGVRVFEYGPPRPKTLLFQKKA